MSDVTLERVLEDVKALSPVEQLRLREQLDRMLELSIDSMTRGEFDRYLLEIGLLRQIPKGVKDPAKHKEFEPIKIKGKPLSETIIEDREDRR